MNKHLWRCLMAAGCCAAALPIDRGVANELPTGTQILDSDLVLEQHCPPILSPNGKRVAYISKGQLWVVDAGGGKPRRLVALPDTWSAVLVRPEYKGMRSYSDLLSKFGREEFDKAQALVTHGVSSLEWVPAGNALAYLWRTSHSPNNGVRLRLVELNTQTPDELDVDLEYPFPLAGQFRLSCDRRVGVFDRHKRALIWNLETNKPRATPFLKLTRGSSTNRWIGIEKDSREIVVADAEFQVVHRSGEFVPVRSFGLDLQWSGDERFVLWRNQIGFDHYSNWEGCRLDLRTGKRRILTGDYMAEDIKFTGKGGELLRAGHQGTRQSMSGLAHDRSYVELIPEGDWFSNLVWNDWSHPDEHGRRTPAINGNVEVSVDGQWFVALLRKFSREPTNEFQTYLFNRDREFWQFSDDPHLNQWTA